MTQRNRIVIAFDEHYMRNGQVVYAAARHLMRQTAGTAEYRIFGRGRYRGPRFTSRFGKVRIAARRQGAFRHEPRFFERVRRWLERFRLADARARWISNVEPGDEALIRWLFDADQIHAVVVFTLDPEFALQVARMAHVFSTAAPPHIIVVTPQERAESVTVRDLRWLQARLIWDAAAIGSSAAQAVGSARGSRRMWLPTPELYEDEPVRALVPMAFDTTEPVSLLDSDVYPNQLNVDTRGIDWAEWIGEQCTRPRRVRDIVLFFRPDWMSCGSATLFESLAAHFRRNDALLIDIAVWPYSGNFHREERNAKVAEQQEHIRSALFFSARRSRSMPHILRQALLSLFFVPTTVSNQTLLLNAFSAKPAFLTQAVQHAKISLIYVNHYFTWLYAKDLIAGRRFFLDTHDIQSINYVHNSSPNVLTRRADEYDRLLAQEMRILQRAERLCFVSTSELEIAAQYLPRDKLDYIIALPSIRRCKPRELGKPARMLLVASRNRANERNLQWFFNEVWPRLLDWQDGISRVTAEPVLQLDICGSIDTTIKDPKWRWVTFHGQTENLRPYYEQSDLVLLPVVTGGGVAVKTVEALLYGRPVVATRHALRGLPDRIVDTVGYSNDPEEFAQTILALLDSPVLRREFADRAHRGATMLREERFYDRLVEAMNAVRLTDTPARVAPVLASRPRASVPAIAEAMMVREVEPQPQPQPLGE